MLVGPNVCICVEVLLPCVVAVLPCRPYGLPLSPGMKSRGVYETPGGTILLTARRAMESITLDRGEAHIKVGSSRSRSIVSEQCLFSGSPSYLHRLYQGNINHAELLVANPQLQEQHYEPAPRSSKLPWLAHVSRNMLCYATGMPQWTSKKARCHTTLESVCL